MNTTNKKFMGGHLDAFNLCHASAVFSSEPPPRRLTIALRQLWHVPARLALGGGILAAGLVSPVLGQTLELSDLDGGNGFVLNGAEVGDYAGISVSNGGDINGDGIDDILIGAPATDFVYGDFAGQGYVVFGSSAGLGSALELSALDGRNGFAIRGELGGSAYSLGASISNGGDVNGDELDDVLIGAPAASVNGTYSGESYVVFGSSAFSPAVELSDLDGRNGFILTGSNAYDFLGTVSSAGDVNGDGIDDIIIGAQGASPNGDSSGQSYVVFGSSEFGSTLELPALDGRNGFVINGINAGDRAGASVSSAGDVNGDGLDDILIGALAAGPNGDFSGQSYVVFGSSTGFASVLELSALDGHNGFAINGINAGDEAGTSVSGAGDVNGDGLNDILVGAPAAGSDNQYSGQSYVVFGSGTGFASVLELSALDGHNGFAINGINAGDRSGYSVSGAGDVNGDGLDDVLIGASSADASGNEAAGQSYVVFGSSEFSPALELSALDGRNGFAINGINELDNSGHSVSGAGEINNDGLDDILIGAPFASPNGFVSGQSYVVFGALTSPLVLFEDLTAQVKALDIAGRPKHHLLRDLSIALKAFEKGRLNRAASKIKVLAHRVMVLRGNGIPESDAGVLITQAEALLKGLLSEPVALFENLIIEVKAAELARRPEHSLVDDLNTALKAFKRGRLNRSVNMLGVFINHVEVLRGRKIAPADADAFIAQAERILGGLR